MNCKDCFRLLERYVDRELTTDEIAHVKLHLALCGGCDKRFHFESQLKRLVRISCCQDRAPDSLRERLHKILS